MKGLATDKLQLTQLLHAFKCASPASHIQPLPCVLSTVCTVQPFESLLRPKVICAQQCTLTMATKEKNNITMAKDNEGKILII